VTDTQVTLVQLDNYGPWTTTPRPRREPDLQALQADIYADLARLFGTHDAYVFFARFDNVVAVTNGVGRDAHERIQESLSNRYPVTVSLGVGRAPHPAEALDLATERLQATGGAQEAGRVAAFGGEPTAETSDGAVRIAHFDVVDATGELTDSVGAFDAYRQIERANLALADHLYDDHGALAFFVGGDNVIAVCPEMERDDFDGVIAAVEREVGVGLRVGVGRGATAVEAGMAAKHALENCRDGGRQIGGIPAARNR
jgi:GTP cyclohydrolase IIa